MYIHTIVLYYRPLTALKAALAAMEGSCRRDALDLQLIIIVRLQLTDSDSPTPTHW